MLGMTWPICEQSCGELRICPHLLHWRLLIWPPFMSTAQHPKPTSLHPAIAGLTEQIDALRELGAMLWQRGWSVGTSSNYSVVVSREPLELLITASGKDKGRLARHDFVRVAANGKPTVDGQPKSSAETLLHVVAAQQPGVGAVLHTHSIWSTLLSDIFCPQGGLEIGFKMRTARLLGRRRSARFCSRLEFGTRSGTSRDGSGRRLRMRRFWRRMRQRSSG